MPAELNAPVDACSIAGPNGTRIPTDEPHAWVSRKGPDNVWVRTCQLCPAIDWDDLREGMLMVAAATFKETAGNLNVEPDVQGNENPAASTTPASMGGPLSEAEQLRAENAKLLRKLELANKHRQHSIESRHKLERKLIGWREAAESAAKERDAYKRAKQENDERFQLAAAEAREERDEARARVGVLEGQLATAQAESVQLNSQLKDPGLDWLIDWAMGTDRDARDHYFHINDGDADSCDCKHEGEGSDV